MLGGSGVPAGYSAVADLVGGYVRFHGGTAKPPPSYGRQALMSWARRITDVWPDEGDVYVYFNNDLGGAAVADGEVRAGGRRAGPDGEPCARVMRPVPAGADAYRQLQVCEVHGAEVTGFTGWPSGVAGGGEADPAPVQPLRQVGGWEHGAEQYGSPTTPPARRLPTCRPGPA